MRIFYFFLSYILFFLIVSCSHQEKTSSLHLMTVQADVLTHSLYYSGTVQPLRTLVVTSPAEGTIIEMPFQYGDSVKSGQLLFVVSSSKFLADYKSGLMAYVKAKNEYNTAEAQLSESKFLHTNKLISDDDYKMKQSNYYMNRLALLQAKDTLENLLNQLNIKDINLYQLTIADIDKITKALQFSSDSLRILSPVNGMVLSASKNEEENKKVSKGEMIKQGDVLAVIGEMHGLIVRIKVNELTVNQLHLGQKVKVTGIAFPEETLSGQIKLIDHQGEAAGSGMPVFAVDVVVERLSEKQQQEIHVGMSAKVEISISDLNELSVPIASVKEKNGETFVTVYNPISKKSHLQSIKTGKTTLEKVTVLSGLKAGEQIELAY